MKRNTPGDDLGLRNWECVWETVVFSWDHGWTEGFSSAVGGYVVKIDISHHYPNWAI